MTKKQILGSISFVLVVCVVLYFLCDLFEFGNNYNSDKRFHTYRELNDDTVDAVIIGTSGIDRYWISAQGYEENGITCYTLATDGAPVWLYEYMLEEALNYQDLDLLIIDMRAFGCNETNDEKMDARARKILDSLAPLSLNRVKAGLHTMKVFHDNFEDKTKFDISYLLSFVKYHEEWSADNYYIKRNLFSRDHEYLGYFMNEELTIAVEKQKPVVYNHELYKDLDPIAEEAFYELMDYLEGKEQEVLFLLTPKYMTKNEIGRMNTLMDMLEEEGHNYINYCETDENGDFLYDLNLKHKKDFYNDGHVNFGGAKKFTHVFGQYLVDNYDLPDRRADENVSQQWDGILDKIEEKVKYYKNKAKK